MDSVSNNVLKAVMNLAQKYSFGDGVFTAYHLFYGYASFVEMNETMRQIVCPEDPAEDWKNAVRFFGETWQTIGFPQEGIEDLIPLSWNKKVLVERYG